MGWGEGKLSCTNISFRWGKVILLDSSLWVNRDTFQLYEPVPLQVQLRCIYCSSHIGKTNSKLEWLAHFEQQVMYFLPYSWIRGLFLTVIFFCIFFVLIKICQLWEDMGDEELHKDKLTKTRHKPSPCDSPFVLPLTRFCLSEMKVFTLGNALTTSSLNCCTNGASVVFARSSEISSLEAKHCTAFCALFKITITSDNVVCFTR